MFDYVEVSLPLLDPYDMQTLRGAARHHRISPAAIVVIQGKKLGPRLLGAMQLTVHEVSMLPVPDFLPAVRHSLARHNGPFIHGLLVTRPAYPSWLLAGQKFTTAD